MLKTRLCMGCTKGFLIVDLETLDTQPLVDPTDPSLEFIEKKDNLRPLAIFRVDTEFLLCYDGMSHTSFFAGAPVLTNRLCRMGCFCRQTGLPCKGRMESRLGRAADCLR